jgi:ATP-dependent helicase/nuclease subunit B
VLTIRGVSFDVVTTAYGRPALEALASTVRRAKRGEPLAPVTVIVPANHVGVTARRLLAAGIDGPLADRGRGTIGVTFLTVHRLAELLGVASLVARGHRPVSTPVITAALRAALHAEPGIFEHVADHPATEEALVSTYRELADIDADARDRLAAASTRAADVVRLCGAARTQLAARWYDESDLIGAARAALQAPSGDAARAAMGHLVVYLPQDLTRQPAALLRDAAESRPATVIAALCGDDRPDGGVLRSLARLGVDLEDRHDDRDGGWDTGDRRENPAAAAPRRLWCVHPATTRLVTTSDADDEVRVAVRAVVDEARAGTPLERIAILFPAPQPYARLLHEHLAAADLPFCGASVRTLNERVLGRTLSHLLALRDGDYRRRDVMGLLTSVPLRSPNGAGPPTAEWERLSREAAVVAGRVQWDHRLSDLADTLDQRAAELESAASDAVDPGAEADDDYRMARAGRHRRRAERVRELRRLVLDLIDSIETAAAQPRPWSERVRWLGGLARLLVGGDAARDRWPEDERKAAEQVESALDRIALLDEIDRPCTLDVFRRTLMLELDADLGRTGRLGEGVLVGPLSYGIGLDLDLLVVLGAAEGTLPTRPVDDSLLPDHERAAIAGELPLRREYPERQQRQLVAALASAQRHLLCAPRGDLRVNYDRAVSRWLEEMTATDEGSEADLVVDKAPSFAHGVRHVAFPATEQEYRLRAGDAAPEDAILDAGRALLAARQSTRFTRFDGNLSGVTETAVDHALHDEIVSPTRLETWSECPHAYFMRYILRVEPVEDPEELLSISALEKGSLVHEVLDRFYGAIVARAEHEAIPLDRTWTDEDRELLAQIAHDVSAAYEARGVVGRDLFWQRDRHRILTRLDRFLREDDERRRANGSRPIATELRFGFPDASLPPVEMPIFAHRSGSEPAPRTLRFRGAADRVDRCRDGTLLVIDYKTGRSNDYRGLSEDNPDDRGTHLQLPVYGLAARAHHGDPMARVRAEYWFINDRESLVTRGYAVTDEVLMRVGSTLATITDGIAAGIFPPRPTATASEPFIRCHYCDPDGLVVADRRRQWERKRDDPFVALYTRLAEPPEDNNEVPA